MGASFGTLHDGKEVFFMPSKQNIRAIDAWQAKNIERIVIKPNRRDHISDRIQIAIDRGLAKSRQGYILDAVRRALEADGIPKIEDELQTKT